MKIDTNRYYTVSEVARLMDCTTATIYNWIRSGLLRRERAGKIRIKGAWLLAFRAKHTTGGEA
jgi:excisionase family DNA binding protein